MAVFNTGYNAYANPYQQYGVTNSNYGYVVQPQLQGQQFGQPQYSQGQYPQEQVHYVHGIDGANAFQLPPGVNKITLWDEDKNSFYVKGYDNNGVPRVLAWNDYAPHVEEKIQETQAIDMSKYATKDDIKDMLSSIDFSAFLTKNEFDNELSKLSVGERGRIVRTDEYNA